MADFTIAEAADLLGVSDDTVRRWVDVGRLRAHRSGSGRWAVAGADLAALAEHLGAAPTVGGRGVVSARNRMPGIVTRVARDSVMARVDVQAGPHRLVSLVSREAADELGLETGVLAVASVKATSVVVEVPR
ncbi:TOBE domain-containing protein [Cellulomonas pakistanensis]|nr:TOBE domain-containing protein [Cellulomonas pakistanensis]